MRHIDILKNTTTVPGWKYTPLFEEIRAIIKERSKLEDTRALIPWLVALPRQRRDT